MPPTYNAYPRNIPGKTFLPNWWSLAWSLADIGQYSIIAPKGIIGPVNGSPTRLSQGVVPSARRSWTYRRTRIAFHGISPPLAEVPSSILRTALSAMKLVQTGEA